jgi:hypothetical protein
MSRRPQVTDEALWDLIDHGPPAVPAPRPATWPARLYAFGAGLLLGVCLAALAVTCVWLIYALVTG